MLFALCTRYGCFPKFVCQNMFPLSFGPTTKGDNLWKRAFAYFLDYNQWQECYEELKKPLGKSIQFKRGVPELPENLILQINDNELVGNN